MMPKATQLQLLRGLKIKVARLQELVSTHFNADGWDTEAFSTQAAMLLDECMDILQALRNEAT